MCFGGSAPALPAAPPDNSVQQREDAAAKERQALRQHRAKASGIRSTINPETGFLGVQDDDLTPGN